MIPILDGYKGDGAYSFPSHDRDPKTKGKEYCKSHAQAIYSLYCNNQTAWGVGLVNEFSVNRAYSRGDQSTDQYKSFLLNEYNDNVADATQAVESWDGLMETKESKRMGWLNLNWKNLSPAPMILNSLHGMLDKQDFDLYVNTIDADSRGLMEDAKYRKMVEAKFYEWQLEYKKNAGIPVDEEVVYPKTPEEFDMFEAEDGFKLAVATTMQKLSRHSFDISDWDGTIRKKVVDDLICIGYGAVRDYFDPEENKWKVKYLDPARLIIQYSHEFDYNDAEFAGYLTYWTISNLRNKLPECPEDELKQLAQGGLGHYGNPSGRWELYSELDPSMGGYKYDTFKVPVLECEWMDFDSEKRLYYRNNNGRNLIIDLGYDGKVWPMTERSKAMGATKEVKKIGVRQPYQCSWVLGSDYVFDFGKVNMASREDLNKPALTFHVEQLLQPSIIDNLQPIFDEIAQLYLRYQNSLAMMVERGYAINTSMLGNVNLGGGTMPVWELVKMWQQTGRLLYSYGGNGLYTGGAALPVTPIDGGLGTRVDETVKGLEFAFKKIELFVGINLASLGVTPEPNVATSSVQTAQQATMNALKPILDATYEIKQSAGTSIMRRLQVSLRNSEKIRNVYKGVVSPTEIDALVEMEGNGVQYGMSLKAKPDTAMKAMFAQWLATALQDTRDGNAGLYTSDAMWFTARLEAGEDIYDLLRQMRYQIRKNQEEKEKRDMAKIDQQIQGNAQNEQAKAQNEMQRIQLEGQLKAQEEMIRGQIKDKNLRLEQNYKIYEELRKAADVEMGINVNVSR
jgi:hypothetical protein